MNVFWSMEERKQKLHGVTNCNVVISQQQILVEVKNDCRSEFPMLAIASSTSSVQILIISYTLHQKILLQ